MASSHIWQASKRSRYTGNIFEVPALPSSALPVYNRASSNAARSAQFSSKSVVSPRARRLSPPATSSSWSLSTLCNLTLPCNRPFSTSVLALTGPTPPLSLSKSGSKSATSSKSSTTKAATPAGIFYRSLVPSMIACLAIASCVYYALELTYVLLEREKRGIELAERVEALETELGRLMTVRKEDGVRADGTLDQEGRGTTSRQSWWKFW